MRQMRQIGRMKQNTQMIQMRQIKKGHTWDIWGKLNDWAKETNETTETKK